MSLIARVRSRVAAMVGRQTFEDEMSTEMRSHIENYVDDLVGAGMSREEAMRRARLEFGTRDAIKDD
jgi:putative ABC transport system permease protein